jgi:tRNA threonylcarbamoyladenosine biosynthesis protein TsaB
MRFWAIWQGNCRKMAFVLTLAIDTSSLAGSLAVLRGEKVIGVVFTWAEETYSARMFRHLDFLLGELSLGLEQFDLFAVAAGPGSFTGLRVGLSAAKGWGEAYGKPIAAVSALEAIAVQSRSTATLLVPVLDARRGQVYFSICRRSASDELRIEGQEYVMAPEEFVGTLRGRVGEATFAIVTPTPEVLSSVSQSEIALVGIEAVPPVLAPLIGRLGFERAQRGETTDALHLDANYVRRSDAELNWKEPPGP